MGEIFDVVIVGAGPAGLSAAIYTGRARLGTLVLEKAIPGGQILLTDWIENYPGFPAGVAPMDLMKNIRAQAEKFGARFETDEVKTITRRGDRWFLAGHNRDYEAGAIIIATGSNYRKLCMPNEDRLVGRGISYCSTCDGAFFSNRDVAVVGGGNDALTEALILTKYCRKVWIIHRREEFRAEKILQERIFSNPKTEVLWKCVVQEIQGETHLESVILRNIKENRSFPLKIDGLFVSIGVDPASHFVKDLVETDELGRIKVTPAMETSEPGIFAAGDVTDACPNQMATAVGTGVQAALTADEYLSKN
jgi:thioredoxin reductase (NADPH)